MKIKTAQKQHRGRRLFAVDSARGIDIQKCKYCQQPLFKCHQQLERRNQRINPKGRRVICVCNDSVTHIRQQRCSSRITKHTLVNSR